MQIVLQYRHRITPIQLEQRRAVGGVERRRPAFDGLEIQWHDEVFCNPPYSQARLWIEKAIPEKENCDSIVLLLPNWTDRKWFQLVKDYPIEFLQGKRYFLTPEGKKADVARWGSML